MARYWVGASGNWSDTAHWAASSGGAGGETVPGTTTDVLFDAESSHPGHAAYTVTVDAAANCQDLTFNDTAGGVPTLAGSAALNLYGSLSLVSGMVSSHYGMLSFRATSGTKTVATNTVALNCSQFNYNGSGSTLQLSTNIAFASAGQFNQTAGTFDPNGKTVTFLGTNAAFGSNCIFYDLIHTGTAIKTGLISLLGNVTVTHNLTINGNSPANRVLVTSDTIDTARTITTGGAITLSNVDYRDITFQSTNARTISSAASDGATGTRFLTAAAHGLVAGMTVLIAGTTNYNGSIAVLNVSDTTHFDIATAYVSSQAGTWTHDFSTVALATGGVGGGVCSGLVGLTPNVARTLYFHEAEAGANSFSTVGKWFDATNGGGTVSTTPPLMQDTAKFNADSFDAGSKVVTQDMPRIGSVDWTGATNLPTYTLSGTQSWFGSATLVAGMTYSSGVVVSFEGRGSYLLSSAGKTWSQHVYIKAPGGSLTLQDALSGGSLKALAVTNGTLNCGNQNVTFGDLSLSDGTATRGIVFGTALITLTDSNADGNALSITTSGLTIDATGSTIKFTSSASTSQNIALGGATLNNIWISPGAGTVLWKITGGGTLGDFKDDGTAAHSVKFTKTTTTTVASWNVGTASSRAGNTNVITLDTVDGAGTFALTKTGGGGLVCTSLNIQRSVAGGAGALWWAGPAPPSVNNNGAGSGWMFTAPPQVLLYGIGGY